MYDERQQQSEAENSRNQGDARWAHPSQRGTLPPYKHRLVSSRCHGATHVRPVQTARSSQCLMVNAFGDFVEI
jgi:hypothetical protein